MLAIRRANSATDAREVVNSSGPEWPEGAEFGKHSRKQRRRGRREPVCGLPQLLKISLATLASDVHDVRSAAVAASHRRQAYGR